MKRDISGQVMRTRIILFCLGCSLPAIPSRADSWVGAQPRTFVSQDGASTALVIPASEDDPCRLYVYHENEPDPSVNGKELHSNQQMRPGEDWIEYNKRVVEEWQHSPARRLLWKLDLDNRTAPVDVFVSDEGRYVVTLDNWHAMGYGDEVAAFYHAEGLIKKYALEAILPLPDEDRNDFNGPHEIHLKIFPYGGLFPHSVSSRWWRQNGVELMTSQDNQLLFGVWLPWKKGWVVWDVRSGGLLEDHSGLLDRLNRQARRQVLGNMDSWEGRRTAPYFLTYNKNPEDRQVIESLLSDENFSTGSSCLDDVLLAIHADSNIRCLADMALAVWDGKLDDFTECRDYQYNHLGSVEGTIVLPEIPSGNQSLYVYLVPAAVPEKEWADQPFLQTLSITFNSYHPPASNEIPFRISGITPGTYYVKMSYATDASQRRYHFLRTVYTPQPGDYISADVVTLDVHKGERTEIKLVCDRKVNDP